MLSPRATESVVDTSSCPKLRPDCARAVIAMLTTHSRQHCRRAVGTAAYTCANCKETCPSKFCSPHHDKCCACQTHEYLNAYDEDYKGIANRFATIDSSSVLEGDCAVQYKRRTEVWSKNIKSHDTRLCFLDDERRVKTSDIECCICNQYKDISLFAPPRCCGNSTHRRDIFQRALLALKPEQTDAYSSCDADEQFFEVYRKSHPYCDDCIKTHGCVPLTLERDSPLYELNHPYARYLRATAASRKSQTVDTSPLGDFLQMLRRHRHSERSDQKTNDVLTGLEHQFGKVCRGDDDDAIVLPDFADLCCAADLGDSLSGTLVCAVRIGSNDASDQEVKESKMMLICHIVAGEELARFSLYYRINQIYSGKSCLQSRFHHLETRIPPPDATVLRIIMLRQSLNEIIDQARKTDHIVDKYLETTVELHRKSHEYLEQTLKFHKYLEQTFEQLTTILTSTRTDFVLKRRHRMNYGKILVDVSYGLDVMLSRMLQGGSSVEDLKSYVWILSNLKTDACFFSNLDMSSHFLLPLFDPNIITDMKPLFRLGCNDKHTLREEGDLAALNHHKDPPWLPLTKESLMLPFFKGVFVFMYEYASIDSNLCRSSHRRSCHLRLFKRVVVQICTNFIPTKHNAREVVSMFEEWLNLIKSADFVEPHSPWKADCARIIVVCCVRHLLQCFGARTPPSKRTENCLETVFPILPDQWQTREEMSWMRVDGLDECVCRPYDIVRAIHSLEWLYLGKTPFLTVLSDIVNLYTELVLRKQDCPNSNATAFLVHVAHCAIGATIHRETPEVVQLLVDTRDCLLSWSNIWDKKLGSFMQVVSHAYSHTRNSSNCNNYLLSSLTFFYFDSSVDTSVCRFFGLQEPYITAIVRKKRRSSSTNVDLPFVVEKYLSANIDPELKEFVSVLHKIHSCEDVNPYDCKKVVLQRLRKGVDVKLCRAALVEYDRKWSEQVVERVALQMSRLVVGLHRARARATRQAFVDELRLKRELEESRAEAERKLEEARALAECKTLEAQQARIAREAKNHAILKRAQQERRRAEMQRQEEIRKKKSERAALDKIEREKRVEVLKKAKEEKKLHKKQLMKTSKALWDQSNKVDGEEQPSEAHAAEVAPERATPSVVAPPVESVEVPSDDDPASPLPNVSPSPSTSNAESALRDCGTCDDDKFTTCVVCMTRPRTMAYLPCGHFVVCGKCANACASKCVMCNEVSAKMVQIFM